MIETLDRDKGWETDKRIGNVACRLLWTQFLTLT